MFNLLNNNFHLNFALPGLWSCPYLRGFTGPYNISKNLFIRYALPQAQSSISNDKRDIDYPKMIIILKM